MVPLGKINLARPLGHDPRQRRDSDDQLKPEKEFVQDYGLSADSIRFRAYSCRVSGESLDVGFEVVENPIGLGGLYDQDEVVFRLSKAVLLWPATVTMKATGLEKYMPLRDNVVTAVSVRRSVPPVNVDPVRICSPGDGCVDRGVDKIHLVRGLPGKRTG